jgi:hypothetical protein
MMAATASAGNAGFLIYVADSCGYAGSVSLLLIRTFAHVSLPWSNFLCITAYVLCGVGLVAMAFAASVLPGKIAVSGRG